MSDLLPSLSLYNQAISQPGHGVQYVPDKAAADKLGEVKYTVKAEHSYKAAEVFDEIARQNNVTVAWRSEVNLPHDYGDGSGKHSTFSFGFRPDNPDGTFSFDLATRINNLHVNFEEFLDGEGIRNYAPA